MKSRSVVFGMLLALGILLVAPLSAQAVDVWAVVSVDRVGQMEGVSAGHFTHVSGTPLFTNKFFAFVASGKKEMLATALTAVSLGKNVTIRIKNSGTAQEVIDIMWLRNE